MRGEPKTQKEILAALGGLPPDQRTCFDRWKEKTLENRHVALAFVCFAFVFLLYATLSGGKKAATVHFAPSSSAVHFSRDRPQSILVIDQIPPFENADDWRNEIDRYDRDYHLVVVVSVNVRFELFTKLDSFLKSKGIQDRATWFFAAQRFSDNGGDVYLPSSPRLMLTSWFHSLVLGQQVEFLSSISDTEPHFIKRLKEGQGDLRTRIILLPNQLARESRRRDELRRYGPLMIVSSEGHGGRWQIWQYGNGESNGPVDNFQQPGESQPCRIAPFAVADWKWNCVGLREPMRNVAAEMSK